jgi:predicted NBD/HSP70 family sugar kinase
MPRSIGVAASRYLWAGVVDGTTLGSVRIYPEPGDPHLDLKSLPVDEILDILRRQILDLAAEGPVESVGAGLPGIIRCGIIEESPNLGQLKGLRVTEELGKRLRAGGLDVRVVALNDADALAAGIAGTRDTLDRTVRVWYLGDGIGFGRHPHTDGVWEAGHMVVTLDPKEHFCGCGGIGHLEGIMGHRAMRLRFLDMEPEEVFAASRQGEGRERDFCRLWHRALAAATATSVHLDGPGRFYLAGPNADYVDLNVLDSLMHEMVTMTPLQGSHFEIVQTSHDLALIGAAVASRLR